MHAPLWFLLGSFYCIIGLPVCESVSTQSNWLKEQVDQDNGALLTGIWLTWPVSLSVILIAEWVGRLRK